MIDKIYNSLENNIRATTPEKNLWMAVLERLLMDYTLAVDRAKRSKQGSVSWREVQSMIRMMRSEHLEWICEVCDVHPDRIIDFMYRKISQSKVKVDFRYHKTWNKEETL